MRGPLTLLLLGACAGPPTATPPATFSVHEWGFVEVELPHDVPEAHVRAPTTATVDDRELRVHGSAPLPESLAISIDGVDRPLVRSGAEASLAYRAAFPQAHLLVDGRVTAGALTLEAHDRRPRSILAVSTAATGSSMATASRYREGSLDVVELADDPQAAVDAFLGEAADLGLTTVEVAEMSATFRPRMVGPDAPFHAVYYWLDTEAVETGAPLTSSPRADEVRRAYLVRLVVHRDSGVCATGMGSTAARRPATPHVHIASPTVEGALPSETARRAIRRNMGQVRACCERALAEGGDLVGSFVLVLDVDGTGRVTGARVEHGTLEAPEVETCVVERAHDWPLGPTTDGRPATVTVPFTLEPSE